MAETTWVEVDGQGGEVQVWNRSGVATDSVMAALPENVMSLMARQMGQWASATRGGSRRGGLFERDRYVTPEGVFPQMRLAYDAVEHDDVVSGVLESTEALAFQKVEFHSDEMDEQDVYNQWAADVDLDARLREMWRELFTVSQFYCAIWWDTKTYKVRGKSRKATRRIRAPRALSILDPLKIVPVGLPMFNQDQLAWIATRDEDSRFDSIDPQRDPIFSRLIVGRYEPTEDERRRFGAMDIAADRLWLMNPANVFRHTATKPQYQMWASVRMKSVFELLDLKHQLRSMDRAHLIGGTNFIVLITQGSDQHPGKPDEIAHLQASVRTIASTPVMVGDHRLKVEIVTPKLDQTLEAKRYDTLDSRIAARLYQTFVRSSGGDRVDNSEKLVKVVAAGMESRRKMLRRTLERAVLRPMFEMNDSLRTEPRLQYAPKEIALAFDSAFASFLLDLRESREISRHTILNQFGMSQAFEAAQLEREAEEYDDIFQTINPNNQGQPGVAQPAAQPVKKAAKKAAEPATRQGGSGATRQQTRQAGRRSGGAAPGSGQGQAPRRQRKLAADEEEPDDHQDD